VRMRIIDDTGAGHTGAGLQGASGAAGTMN